MRSTSSRSQKICRTESTTGAWRRRFSEGDTTSRATNPAPNDEAADMPAMLAAIESARAEAQRKAGASVNVTDCSDVPITREDAERFITFLKDCGGFRVC
jgi:hypothetical protein